jgi:L-amino acid N-acyltransferase YncA
MEIIPKSRAIAGVRVATENDAAAVARIYAPYVRETAITFEEIPPSADEMGGRVRTTLKTHPFLVFEDGGSVVAYAYASPHRERPAYRWSADVAIYAVPEVHRRGMGRALYARLLDILRRQGFHSAFAGVTLPNQNSVGLHEAMGFGHVGIYAEVGFKLGAWRDVGWWQCRIAGGPPCGAPIAFPDLRET